MVIMVGIGMEGLVFVLVTTQFSEILAEALETFSERFITQNFHQIDDLITPEQSKSMRLLVEKTFAFIPKYERV